jgi:hypothetical protein
LKSNSIQRYFSWWCSWLAGTPLFLFIFVIPKQSKESLLLVLVRSEGWAEKSLFDSVQPNSLLG